MLNFRFKNTSKHILTVFMEPSTDEVQLHLDDVLEIHWQQHRVIQDQTPIVECDYDDHWVIIWISQGFSARLHVNGQPI